MSQYRQLTDKEKQNIQESAGDAIGNGDADKCPVWCPKCNADPGDKCQTSTGNRNTYLHGSRAKAWARWDREDGEDDDKDSDKDASETTTDDKQESNKTNGTTDAPDDVLQAVDSLKKRYGSLGEDLGDALVEVAERAATASSIEPSKVVVEEINGGTEEIEHAHKKLDQVLWWVARTQEATHPFLVGPPGGGKGTLASQVANAYDKEFVIIPLSPDDMVYDMVGFRGANGQYVETPLTEAWEDDNFILFDELDRARPSTLTRLNEALSSGRLETPGGTLDRHPDGIVVGAGNSLGHGADSAITTGQQLDLASLDRWSPVIEIDYDADLEASLAASYAGETGKKWADLVDAMRAAARDLGIDRHPATTRAVITGAQALANPGPISQDKAKHRVLRGTILDKVGQDQAERLKDKVRDDYYSGDEDWF
jgi:MoxR-like ATPase